jgi:hypothetical protein
LDELLSGVAIMQAAAFYLKSAVWLDKEQKKQRVLTDNETQNSGLT